ncbi:alpha/beta fold hydrolase [Streptomyces sp. NPDC001276]|uniref:alpha/beta fold hydrolase n=1 Tax=Streptomyces sp. NPDC001276 TaxID=3364555 RepID=UPI0036744073
MGHEWDTGDALCGRVGDGHSPPEPGRPGYTGTDLVGDATRVLDAYGIPAAHVVGVSAGGALAQLLALHYPRCVLSLVLISTSSAVPGNGELPAPTGEFIVPVRHVLAP